MRKLLGILKSRMTKGTVKALVGLGVYILYKSFGIEIDPLLMTLIDAVCVGLIGYGIFNNPTDKENY